MAHIITGEQIGGNKPWVAKITGLDPKYGLAREFVRGIRDYSGSNSVGSRGIETTFALEDGIYEINIPRSWKQTDREFIRVADGKYSGCLEKAEIVEAIKDQEVQK
jgi:hypothetical protein